MTSLLQRCLLSEPLDTCLHAARGVSPVQVVGDRAVSHGLSPAWPLCVLEAWTGDRQARGKQRERGLLLCFLKCFLSACVAIGGAVAVVLCAEGNL